VKEWGVIHKIKALHDGGQGLSIRRIGERLNLSRNTVRKYLRMDENAIAGQIDDPSRIKLLDEHRDFIVQLIGRYPAMSAVKVARKLRTKVGDTVASQRTLRRYVRELKETYVNALPRYYEPIVDDLPGVQCQVDPGELRGVLIGDQECTVYFVVFVLSYSRLMYVSASLKALDTHQLIQMHDQAMRYFGGRPEECLYDQTTMVVINEQYRELTLNRRFMQYACAAGFQIRACEGGDPESKGKVESGVKYVKNDCLYGEQFTDFNHLQAHIQQWLDEVANQRVHGTTGKVPRDHFEQEERVHLSQYLTPECVHSPVAGVATRQVDKTGLIAWKANKYSVPMIWQRSRVGVREADDQLIISDLNTGQMLAAHALCTAKGATVKNNNHYRDHSQRIADLEQDIEQQIGQDVSSALCRQIQKTEPKIYKDQLHAIKGLIKQYAPVDVDLLMELSARPGMSATKVREYLEARCIAKLREREPMPLPPTAAMLDLSAYQGVSAVGRPSGQAVTL
jgi:transposase